MKRAEKAASATAIGLLTLGGLLGGAAPARADIPDQALLQQLAERLDPAPDCRPDCVSIDALALAVDGSELSLTLSVHAGDRTSVRLPGPAQAWVPATVRLDGKAPAPVARLADGFLHVRVAPGIHSVHAVGPLPPRDTLTLALGDAPRQVAVEAEGWKVDGVREDGRATSSIQLSRVLEAEAQAQLESAALPPWLALTRTLVLGPSWQVHTELVRVSPSGGPVRVRVPLLAGESVTAEQVEVEQGEVVASFDRDELTKSWTSSLAIADAITLTAASGRPFSERWELRCGPVWRCEAKGLTPIERVQDGRWEPFFLPWPGERLEIAIDKPPASEGQSVTIDQAQLGLWPGVRVEKGELTLSMRASRGSAERVALPEGARLSSLTVDGQERPARKDGGAIGFQLEPGTHTVKLEWQRPQEIARWLGVPAVSVGRPAANASVELHVPEDRWLLWARGPAWGPAILFWGYLVLVLLVGLALGRTRQTPLSSLQWGLLALGLTQIPAPAAILVVVWFFAMARRARRGEVGRGVHNLTQLALALLTLAALGCLYAAIHTGLLMQPEMQVAGSGSSSDVLRWYVDRTDGSFPAAAVLSVPMWTWRVAMLAWSLWLAASLLRWLPWAFRCYREGGLWRKPPPRTPPAPPAPPTTAAPSTGA